MTDQMQVSAPAAIAVATMAVATHAVPESSAIGAAQSEYPGMQVSPAATGDLAPVVVAAAPDVAVTPGIAVAQPAVVPETFERTIPIPAEIIPVPTTEPAPVVSAEIAAPETVTVQALEMPAPVQQAPAIVAPPPAPVDLKPALEQAGLIMIETQNAAPFVAYAPDPVVLGRKPRPQVQIVVEPLQMVETRNE